MFLPHVDEDSMVPVKFDVRQFLVLFLSAVEIDVSPRSFSPGQISNQVMFSKYFIQQYPRNIPEASMINYTLLCMRRDGSRKESSMIVTEETTSESTPNFTYCSPSVAGEPQFQKN